MLIKFFELCRMLKYYSVSQKSHPPPNVWLWQVQTCTTLHIILRAQALMYSDYCHQILYKSVLPFCRFSIFTKRCQKVQLPAALPACFLCAVTIFYVNVQHFSINAICRYFISWTYQADFYWCSCEGKWFVLPVDYAICGILQERVYRYQLGDVDHLKERLIWIVPLWSAYHWQSSRPVATSASHNCICEKDGHFEHQI